MDIWPEFKKEFKKFKTRQSFKESIEPEEVLLDAQKHVEFPDQKLETPLKARVFVTFFGIISVGLLILIVWAGYFQLFKNDTYSALAERNSVRVYPQIAPRGLIYDRNLKSLVTNVPSFNIWLSPQDLPQDKVNRDTVIEQISFLLEMEPKQLNEELLNFDFEKAQRILLAANVASDKILALESRLEDFPALNIEEGIIRQYPFGQMLSQVVGYTGKIDKDELAAFSDYFLTERLGKAGLEAQYEKTLRGQAGERLVEVDARGRQIKELGVKEASPGQNIVTTLDLGLQKKIFEQTSRVLKNLNLTKAAVVALDPSNGQVLGLVSLPSFDNNIFEQNISSSELKKILEDTDEPLFNRVIAGQYPSGSSIKPMIGAAALEEKIVTPLTTIIDTGGINVINQYNPNVIYTFPDWKAHGLVNIYSAIAQSCNVYFYTVGGGYGKIEGLGIDRIKKYLELFGLGKILGIDLPGEKDGLVPDENWKEKTKNEAWFIGDTYHVSIGQGDLLVTPLQMASAIASIANGGKLFSPRLVDKITDSDKNSIKVFEPSLIRENFISSENLAVIRKGMRETVISGSARLLADLSVKVAGKTGTAQVSGQARTNAWFVGFAPYDDPKIVLVIMIENAGEGSTVAVPLAKEIFKYYFSK